MHEAGIAASIIEIAEETARLHGASGFAPIRTIGLRLGAFTGVVRESLDFAFEALKAGTLAMRAVLEIIHVPVTGQCPDCGWSGAPIEDFCLICPQCQSPVRILTGRELQVEYVDLGDKNDGTGDGADQGLAQERGMRGVQSPFV